MTKGTELLRFVLVLPPLKRKAGLKISFQNCSTFSLVATSLPLPFCPRTESYSALNTDHHCPTILGCFEWLSDNRLYAASESHFTRNRFLCYGSDPVTVSWESGQQLLCKISIPKFIISSKKGFSKRHSE